MELSVLTTTHAEPVAVAEVKRMMGYLGEDQDDRIARLIKVAREWLENRTALSAVSKQYKAYFNKSDRDSEGWYELPMSPVLSSPAITVSVCGVSTTFTQQGMSRVKIKPDTMIGTLQIGSSSEIYYVEVTFTAGRPNETANECIRRIAASMFNEPQDGLSTSGNVSVSRLAYDTLRLIETIDQTTGF
jgi:hypothetical protein